jgi:hypothetical protein
MHYEEKQNPSFQNATKIIFRKKKDRKCRLQGMRLLEPSLISQPIVPIQAELSIDL